MSISMPPCLDPKLKETQDSGGRIAWPGNCVLITTIILQCDGGPTRMSGWMELSESSDPIRSVEDNLHCANHGAA